MIPHLKISQTMGQKHKQLVKGCLVLFLQLFYTIKTISKYKVTKKLKRGEKENGQC